MTLAQFAVSLAVGILSVVLPLVLFFSLVGLLVYVARCWLDRPGKS